MSRFAAKARAIATDDSIDDDRPPSWCHCHTCGRDYNGSQSSGGHCTVCHRSFTSQTGADRHRTGSYAGGRRCKTDQELLDAGWSTTGPDDNQWRMKGADTGWWKRGDGE